MRLLIFPLLLVAPLAIVLAADRSEWVKGLTQPGTSASCCSIADCHPAPAEWHQGRYTALSRVTGKMIPIPPETVLNDTPSFDGQAYLCENSSARVLCFVKPNPGT